MTDEVQPDSGNCVSKLKDELCLAKRRIAELEIRLRTLDHHADLLEILQLKVDALYAVRQIAAPRRAAAHLRPSNHGEG